MTSINGVVVTPQKIIDTLGGAVFHGLKASDDAYSGFGEAYFSTVDAGAVKGWKRHREMIMNLLVPHGMVRFVIYDDREGSPTNGHFQVITLSPEHYYRLTVPPMVWMGFQGVGEKGGMLLNIASILHDPSEVDHIEIDMISFDW